MTTRASSPEATETAHHRVLIVGGGTGGICVAVRLARKLGHGAVAILEPSDKHYYQPLWTLVGAGVVRKEKTERDEAGLIPAGVEWIRDRAAEVDPARDRVTTESGRVLGYDYLVLAPGMQIDWDRIAGLPEALGHDGVCSIYDYEQAERTWEMIRAFEGGNAVFTMPGTPIKCAGAPQKIMYLAEETFRARGVRGRTKVMGRFAGGAIFGVQPFRDALEGVLVRQGIDFRPFHELREVRPATREAVFEIVGGDRRGEQVVLKYDLLHAVPPMSAPDFVKRSPLAVDDPCGFIDVDKHTTQSPRFPNVFALGDASSLPTSRTGAAIRRQAPVLVDNLLAVMDGRYPPESYDGYAACPLVTSRKTVMLAEFGYDGKLMPSFPLDPRKERYSYWLLKRYGLPLYYWRGMMKGRA